MGWRDRLRAALAAETVGLCAAECAHAETAKTAKTSIGDEAGEVLAQLEVLAGAHFLQNVSAPPVTDPANDTSHPVPSPDASALVAMRAACSTRGPALFNVHSHLDALADHAAVASEVPDKIAPLSIPAADMVEALAAAMAANPANRITDREEAMRYFRGMARNRLATLTGNAMAPGLLLAL